MLLMNSTKEKKERRLFTIISTYGVKEWSTSRANRCDKLPTKSKENLLIFVSTLVNVSLLWKTRNKRNYSEESKFNRLQNDSKREMGTRHESKQNG